MTPLMSAHIAHTARDWRNISGEDVKVERISSAYYGFGSEMACHRLFAKYQSNGSYHNPKARIGYSVNRESWFFCLEA